MSDVTIWHNPRCSKSRQTLALIEDKGITPEIVKYLDDTPDKATLDATLTKLGKEPEEIVRKKEEIFKELGLKDKDLSRDEWLDVLVENPKLIERPIVIRGNEARLGRPPEDVLNIL